MIGTSYSKKASFQQEGEMFVGYTRVEVALVHNARLLRSILGHLQYFSNYIESVSLYLFHDLGFIPYLLLF